MNVVIRGGFALALAVFATAAPAALQEDPIQRSFSGHTVELDLSPGHYSVRGSSDERIRIIPRTKAEEVSSRIGVNMLGTRATVRVTGPWDGFDAEIQVPKRVALEIRVAGGSLLLEQVDGSKNVSATSGTVEIALGDRQSYRRISLSVQKGELAVPGFFRQAVTGRSLEWAGHGPWDLRVRVDNGSVTLRD